MVDRYDGLRQAIAEFKKEISSWHLSYFHNIATPDAVLELLAERDALTAQVEALKADAERYRKLIDSQDARDALDAHSGMTKPIVDSAVDAAEGVE